MKDLVKVTCYGTTETMNRKEAISFYLNCMYNSEGAERDRYVNIYLKLLQGDKVVNEGGLYE
jgi:hypothetical protein